MEDQDYFLIVVVSGLVATYLSYLLAFVSFWRKGESAKDVDHLWGDLLAGLKGESSGQRPLYLFHGWIVSEVIRNGCLIALEIIVYKHIVPIKWWILIGSKVVYYIGSANWFYLTLWSIKKGDAQSAGITVWLTAYGSFLSLCVLMHPDTVSDEGVAWLRVSIVLNTFVFWHSFIMDAVIWQLSFLHRELKQS